MRSKAIFSVGNWVGSETVVAVRCNGHENLDVRGAFARRSIHRKRFRREQLWREQGSVVAMHKRSRLSQLEEIIISDDAR